ncbi:carboxylic acid transporter [Arthroderma uncinatum]|uniref:carboxylic acid transporter n=1 Tax=Arthroderma uncinatum TaxID=74035 RepID=UPI00144A96DC|nr:carboxylic acid transporter [Arthroderma uncinatum]KAF3481590.1 carboxylic acid transporter [Arthroderma uncinatum]
MAVYLSMNIIGLFGPAAATAMEDLPYDARGIASGLFQQGCGTGYLLAAVFYRAFVPTTKHGWRSLFWFGAAPPILIIIFRWCLPETRHFQVMKAERESRIQAEEAALEGNPDINTTHTMRNSHVSGLRAFWRESRPGLQQNWFLMVYLVVIMTGFNSCSHGSQDFYPTFLKDQVGKTSTQTTVIIVVGNIGTIIGGTLIGWISTFLGKRLTMIIASFFGAALIPAYILPRSDALIASSFWQQFFIGGIWGPIPIHLSELSPQSLRGLLVGLTYQLGNLASSASATIQAVIGEKFPLPAGPHGKKRFDYGRVMALFMGAVFAFLFILLLLGPEMSQEERDEEELASRELARQQSEGKTLEEIGRERAGLPHVKVLDIDDGDKEDEAKESMAQHMDNVTPEKAV